MVMQLWSSLQKNMIGMTSIQIRCDLQKMKKLDRSNVALKNTLALLALLPNVSEIITKDSCLKI